MARGYRVVAFDAFGHGESPGNSMSIPELASCIRQVSDELGGVYGVVAHSMGGAATTLALSDGLQLERAVFISPPSDPRVFLQIFSDAVGIPAEVRTHLKERVERRVGITMERMRANRIAPSMQVPLLVEAWPNAELVITEGLGHQRILRDEHVTNVAVSFIDAIQRLKSAA
ncbi:MAG: alpha/beta fold hydrolase [Deltaproteobacteria bacterium]|nr:alpha/beta fold hydrolase [Deltaproteobacteria bacterium]